MSSSNILLIAALGPLLITAFVLVTVVVMRRTTRRGSPGADESAVRAMNVPAFGDDVETRLLEGDPAEVLIAEARRWDADLIVVGSHGYGRAKRMLLGSVSEAVARGAHCSVEIVRCSHAA